MHFAWRQELCLTAIELSLTTHTLQSLWCETTAGSDAIRTQLVQDTADGLRVGKHAGDLAHGTVIVDSLVFTSVQESIPVCHVDDKVVILWTGVVELGEEATGVQIVVIFVDLAECVTDLEVSLKVIHPMALGAVDWDATVGAFEVRMGRGSCVGGLLSGLRVMRRDGGAGLLMIWVWAECVLLDELGAFANFRRGRVGEGVE